MGRTFVDGWTTRRGLLGTGGVVHDGHVLDAAAFRSPFHAAEPQSMPKETSHAPRQQPKRACAFKKVCTRLGFCARSSMMMVTARTNEQTFLHTCGQDTNNAMGQVSTGACPVGALRASEMSDERLKWKQTGVISYFPVKSPTFLTWLYRGKM